MSVAKASYVLKENVQALLSQYGIERIGFLTLTFQDGVTDIKEANRRLNSLMTGYLGSQLDAYILIRERQKRGAWHFHLLAVLPFDLKDRGRWTRRPSGSFKFTTSNLRLLALWKEFREKMPLYGFGRHELLPIRKDSKALAGYLSKYIGKHMKARQDADKGVRLISYSRAIYDSDGSYVSGFLRSVGSSSSFAWHSPFMSRLRKKVSHLARIEGCFSPVDALRELGHTWGFHLFKSAAHIVQMCDIAFFNRDQAHFVPWAPAVSFIDGQICRLDTGEVQF